MTQKLAINSVLFATLPLMLLGCKDPTRSAGGNEGSYSNVNNSRVTLPDLDAQALRRLSQPRRRAKKKPKYAIGPVVVRQVLVDPESQTMLTEEGEVAHCEKHRLSWLIWMKCVDSILATDYGWIKRTAFRVRLRSLRDMSVLGEISYSGKPFPRLFSFRAGVALEAGDERSAMVVHDLRRRDRKIVPRNSLARGENVKKAVILPNKRILTVTVTGDRLPKASLKWLTDGATLSSEQSHGVTYKKKQFLAPNLAKMGMAARCLYVHCGAKDKAACQQIKSDGGIPYAQRLERDRSVNLAATRDGTQVALYAFGTLYIFTHKNGSLTLKRRWTDIFYIDKDNYLKDPGLVFDSSGRWLALTSSRRLNLIVDTQTGGIRPVRDFTKPKLYVSLFNQGRRGAAFIVRGSQTVLLYGDLRGDLGSYNIQTRAKRRWKLPEAKDFDHELSKPELISYLKPTGKQLIAWRNGAVYLLDSRSMRLRARVGTYAALGWSRRLSELSIP